MAWVDSLDTVSHRVVWLSDHQSTEEVYAIPMGRAACGRYYVVPIQLLAVLCGVMLLVMTAGAQTTAGRILGTVTDQSGAGVGGATVSSPTYSTAFPAR